jgi:hypothetical protein
MIAWLLPLMEFGPVPAILVASMKCIRIMDNRDARAAAELFLRIIAGILPM